MNFSNDYKNQFYDLIKTLQKENIDKTGIKFQLSDANTYDDIIKLLDLMEVTEQGRYLFNFNDDNFYVSHIENKYNSEMDDIPVMTCYVVPPEKTFFEKIRLQIREVKEKIGNKEILLLISFLFLVIISFIRPRIFIPYPFKS